MNDNEGGPLTGAGTMVYNRRGTGITVCDGAFDELGNCLGATRNVAGPLNDPTAILYVQTDDLIPLPPNADTAGNRRNPAIPVRLRDNAPVEPLVLRANAGDCIEVTLRNRMPATAPDLAGWQDLFWVVNRDLFAANRNPNQMRFFNNNLIRPSGYVGLHAQLTSPHSRPHL